MKPTPLLLFSFLMMTSVSVQASSLQYGIDNDVLFQTDGDYSNGMFLGYSSSAKPLSSNSYLPLGAEKKYQVNGFALLGQKMWTPSDIKLTTPKDNERPYAGLLYLDSGVMATNGKTAHRLGLMLGIVGPDSGAEDAQKKVHRLLDNSIPKGWDYQVKNKMVADVSYDLDQLMYRSDGSGYSHEFSGYGRLVAGNFQPEVAVGLGWRWGPNLNDSFNASTLRPYRQITMAADGLRNRWYLYGNLEVGYRFDDMTITGDTLKPVSNVDIQKAQMAAAVGAVYFYNSVGLGISATGYSRRFKQDKNQWHFRNALTFYLLF